MVDGSLEAKDNVSCSLTTYPGSRHNIGGGTGGGGVPPRFEGGPPPQCLTFIGINTFDQFRPQVKFPYAPSAQVVVRPTGMQAISYDRLHTHQLLKTRSFGDLSLYKTPVYKSFWWECNRLGVWS